MSEPEGTDVRGHEGERILASFLESTLSGYWDWDLPAGSGYVSPAFKKLLGYEDHELPNSPDVLEKLTLPEDLPSAQAAFERHVQTHGRVPYHNEVRYRCRDGSIRWFLCAGQVMEWAEDGRPLRTVGCHVDITERKKAQEAQLATKAKLEAALASMTDALSISDAEGRFIDFNEAFAKFHRFSGKEECARTLAEYPLFLDVFMANGEPAPLDQWAVPRALRGETVQDAEYILRHKHTGETWVGSYSFAPIRDAGGAIVGSVVVARDVTQVKRAEEALARSLAVLRATGRMAHVGGWELNGATREATWNEEVYRIFEVEADFELEVSRCLDFYTPQARPVLAAAVEAALEKGESFDLELEMVTARGNPRWVHTIGKVERHEGRTSRILGTVQDITERRQWQERIRQSEKMEAIGQLAGGVAHDFNNQLTGILGYAEILAEQLADPGLQRFADRIKTAAMRAADLTRPLLAFSRKGKHVTVPVDLHRVIGEVMALLERSIDKRIEVRQELHADPHFVVGDPTQLQSAFLNLAVNARDAMPQGGEIVFATSVVTLPEDPSHPDFHSGRHVQVSITDSGTGMDAQTMSHLFEPFFTTKEQGRGTGLGLAAVDGAVKNHHGTIRVESQFGKGTTFSVFLPVLERSVTGQDRETQAVRGEARILLVDDEPLIRNLAADILETLGYQVTTCENGAKAVETYQASWRQFDLVVLDMVMPLLSGRDTFTALREINPDVKAILISGHGLEGEAQGILDAGVLKFVQKPFTKADLSRKVAEVLGRAPRQSGPAASTSG